MGNMAAPQQRGGLDGARYESREEARGTHRQAARRAPPRRPEPTKTGLLGLEIGPRIASPVVYLTCQVCGRNSGDWRRRRQGLARVGDGGIECHHGARRGLATMRCASGASAGTAVRASGGTGTKSCQIDTFVKMALASRWLQSVYLRHWRAILVLPGVPMRAWRRLGSILGHRLGAAKDWGQRAAQQKLYRASPCLRCRWPSSAAWPVPAGGMDSDLCQRLRGWG